MGSREVSIDENSLLISDGGCFFHFGRTAKKPLQLSPPFARPVAKIVDVGT
jgi:hypothetical protein